MKFILEDLPQAENRVTVASDGTPELHFEDYSPYAYRGIEEVGTALGKVLEPLPVERIDLDPTPSATEGHILGTAVMGDDPTASVVDQWMIHHRIRNLLVIGGSAFPTGSPANPTLTISALSLRSAAHLFA